MHALERSKMQGQLLGSGNVNKSHKLDKLTSDDILYQIYCLREWFLYLTEDEHLQKNSQKRLGKCGACFPGTHHLGDLLLVLVFLLLLTHIR